MTIGVFSMTSLQRFMVYKITRLLLILIENMTNHELCPPSPALSCVLKPLICNRWRIHINVILLPNYRLDAKFTLS